ncbi:MAG TPA: hypothetical protein V6C90_18260 [Coleofasciculaceae cyanobacterium]
MEAWWHLLIPTLDNSRTRQPRSPLPMGEARSLLCNYDSHFWLTYDQHYEFNALN